MKWLSIAIIASLVAVGRSALMNPQSYLANDDDNLFKTFKHHSYPSHSIKIREQGDDLCDAGSKQYTGWLDFKGKHVFFCKFALDTRTG